MGMPQLFNKKRLPKKGERWRASALWGKKLPCKKNRRSHKLAPRVAATPREKTILEKGFYSPGRKKGRELATKDFL